MWWGASLLVVCMPCPFHSNLVPLEYCERQLVRGPESQKRLTAENSDSSAPTCSATTRASTLSSPRPASFLSSPCPWSSSPWWSCWSGRGNTVEDGMTPRLTRYGGRGRHRREGSCDGIKDLQGRRPLVPPQVPSPRTCSVQISSIFMQKPNQSLPT